ncbi:hypothetical protein ABTE85_22525, partial [Acinetobacter baumannii]
LCDCLEGGQQACADQRGYLSGVRECIHDVSSSMSSVLVRAGSLAAKRVGQANPDRTRRRRRHELLRRERVDARGARQAVRGV